MLSDVAQPGLAAEHVHPDHVLAIAETMHLHLFAAQLGEQLGVSARKISCDSVALSASRVRRRTPASSESVPAACTPIGRS